MADGPVLAPSPWAPLVDGAVEALEGRRLAECRALFDRALAAGMPADLAVEARWQAAMLTGDWRTAWTLSDQVLAARGPEDFNRPWTPYHTRCVWNGRPLAGKRVLIRCYHGLGDTIQFIRFAAPLARTGATVMVEAQPELLPLIAPMPGVAAAVPLGQGDRLDFAVDVESMELAHALRADAGSLPPCPYIHPVGSTEPDSQERPGMTVGLVWRAGGWDARRSVPADALIPLLTIPGVTVAPLQLDAEGRPMALETAAGRVPSAARRDVAGLADMVARIDLLVSVDTMAVHLAGAMGRKAALLLHAAADWRWGLGRRTGWYPSLRLFRQRRPGDWTEPVAELARTLARAAGRRGREMGHVQGSAGGRTRAGGQAAGP